MENNNKLDRLKQFIIDEYNKERLNPIITLDFKIAIDMKVFNFPILDRCPDDAFVDKYFYLNGMTGWFIAWINNEFPNKKVRVYMYDEPNGDLYVKVD